MKVLISVYFEDSGILHFYFLCFLWCFKLQDSQIVISLLNRILGVYML